METQTTPRVLILEDEILIALDVEAILAEAGFEVIGSLATCEGALVWLDENRADVAIFDIHLQDGSCEKVAGKLAEMGIPYVVFSASGADEELDPVFHLGGWLEKPAPAPKIIAAVTEALASRLPPIPSVDRARHTAS